MKTCPKCGGTGGRVVRSLSGWREEDWWLPCSDCQSRGVVSCCESDRECPKTEESEK